jgi:3-hydroxyacyl-CoA dehydrogenase
MGSGIACHFANIGVEVLLLDIVPRELTEAETKLTLESTVVRNRLVNEHLNTAEVKARSYLHPTVC